MSLADTFTPTRAAFDVLTERERQRAKWSDAHDDGHADEALACAAAVLAFPGGEHGHRTGLVPGPAWAHDLRARPRRAQLVTAAALLLAEVERIDRAATPTPKE